MSTPISRYPAQGSPTPTTSTHSLSSFTSSNSASVEPRSEYLRHALDAKRAKQSTPAPTPPETKPQRVPADEEDSDPWLDHAKGEKEGPRVTNRRTRRPSEGPTQRHLTTREQQAETDKMKGVLFDLNMKLELIRQQNHELKDHMDEADERITELEHFEDEVYDLRELNNGLELKYQEQSDEVQELRERNAEILQIQDESVANMEKQNTALEEAAEIILRMEKENDALTQENALLKGQVENFQRTQTDGACCHGNDVNRHPSRVCSIDESRPSTSHFDSDYYSQPSSPQDKVSKESLPSLKVSDRARNFLTLNRESQKSINDLKKRFSDASMKKVRPKSTYSEVPQIPVGHQQDRRSPAPAQQTPARTARWKKPVTQVSPATSHPSTQRTPRTPTEGLRNMFHNNLSLDGLARSSRPSASYAKSPVESKNLRSSQNSDRAQDPTDDTQIPPRHSSRQAQTSGSHEKLPPHHPTQSLYQSPSVRSDPEIDAQTENSEWEKNNPPESVISDLTTVPDLPDYRARWFMTVDKLGRDRDRGTGTAFGPSSTAVVPVARNRQGAAASAATTPAAHHRRQLAPSLSSSWSGMSQEHNFLFNPSEDEDGFMERFKSRRRER
ncbi:hypothetical protein P280DRAFT_478740 [Massarina eburnea CBS 473.64]|uniref:Centrosomin N-terminal motif 1 domain-containing protein n=1 Tax=Massarina eburnea CBS 473.64 TaxID=1395130 RepID=A0A6A6S8X9_9PLEO|nr:hypothetical protein P280DRAFT_478740 [Massarina eburnea CBS 473.64]